MHIKIQGNRRMSEKENIAGNHGKSSNHEASSMHTKIEGMSLRHSSILACITLNDTR